MNENNHRYVRMPRHECHVAQCIDNDIKQTNIREINAAVVVVAEVDPFFRNTPWS